MPALSRRRLALASLSAGLLALFAVSLWMAQTGRLGAADASVEATIRSRGARPADVAASLIALTAGVSGAALWALLLVAAAVLRPRIRAAIVVLLVALAAEQIVELILKTVLDHPGPPAIGRSLFELGGGPQTQGSFPSGHMIRAVVLAGGTALVAGRRAGLVAAAVYVAAVAATRVYLSEHWVSDVIGGTLLGLGALPIIALAGPSPRGAVDRAVTAVRELPR